MSTDAQQAPTDVTPNEAVAIARRLKHVFDLVNDLLDGDQVGRIWAVYGTVGGAAPTVESLDTKADLCELISTLRAQQNSERHAQLYIHMFFGQRWAVQKGRQWKLWDGRVLESIEGGEVEPFLDATGLLRDGTDPDTLLTENAEPDGDADVPQQPAEAEEPAPELQVETPVIGEDAPPAGGDPEIV